LLALVQLLCHLLLLTHRLLQPCNHLRFFLLQHLRHLLCLGCLFVLILYSEEVVLLGAFIPLLLILLQGTLSSYALVLDKFVLHLLLSQIFVPILLYEVSNFLLMALDFYKLAFVPFSNCSNVRINLLPCYVSILVEFMSVIVLDELMVVVALLQHSKLVGFEILYVSYELLATLHVLDALVRLLLFFS